MISWMSEKTDGILDSHDLPLSVMVCEVHDPELKRHVVIQIEYADDFGMQIGLGDCRNIPPKEVETRFIRRFGDFVDAFAASGECPPPVEDELEEMRSQLLGSIGE